MCRRGWTFVLAGLLALALWPAQVGYAADDDHQLIILSAAAAGTTLTIDGSNFGPNSPLPVVRLNGLNLTVTKASNTQISATISGNLAPGTYLLTVIRGRRSGDRDEEDDASRFGVFDLAIGTPPLGTISGQLTSCAVNANFAGYLVYIPGRAFTVFTGANGAFEIDNLPPSPAGYTVSVEAGNVILASASGAVNGAPLTISVSNVGSDVNNCGACGNACSVPNGTPSCSASVCGVAACNAGYVNVSGTCVPALSGQGVSCLSNSACASGSCVDGVCCNTACNGTCVACSAAKKGGGTDGTCGPIKAGTDPDNECVAQSASSCGTTGSCNGAGACQLWAAGTICQSASCSGSTVLTNAFTCNGSGTCGPPSPATTNCAPNTCVLGSCTSNPGPTCTFAGDCTTSSSGHVCLPGGCGCNLNVDCPNNTRCAASLHVCQ
jgi:hypothetical protein